MKIKNITIFFIIFFCFYSISFASKFTTRNLTLKNYLIYTQNFTLGSILGAYIDYQLMEKNTNKSKTLHLLEHELAAHATFLTHETGHILIGSTFSNTNKIEWNFDDNNPDAKFGYLMLHSDPDHPLNKKQKRFYVSGGVLFQMSMSGFLLVTLPDSFYENTFIRSYMLYNILHPVLYSLFTINSSSGDYYELEKEGIKREYSIPATIGISGAFYYFYQKKYKKIKNERNNNLKKKQKYAINILPYKDLGLQVIINY